MSELSALCVGGGGLVIAGFKRKFGNRHVSKPSKAPNIVPHVNARHRNSAYDTVFALVPLGACLRDTSDQ
jgi:hypothetical protein